MSNRAWGRTGTGAVMGSKKLKAIVVRGTQKVVAADRKRVLAISKMGGKELKTKWHRRVWQIWHGRSRCLLNKRTAVSPPTTGMPV